MSEKNPFDAALAALPEDAKGDDIAMFLCTVIASYSNGPGDARYFLSLILRDLRDYYEETEGASAPADNTCNCPRCTARREAEATKH